MQPASPLRRPGGMRRLTRVVAGLAISLGAAAVPIDAVLGCSCVGFDSYEAAIAAADVAFIGTLLDEREPAQPVGIQPTARYAFDVGQSKGPVPNPFEIDATFGGDGNCGFDMTIGQEWLVIASEWQGGLGTNSCTGTTLTTNIEPEELEHIRGALLPIEPAALPEPPGFALDLPLPVIGILTAMLVVGVASATAFRRGGSR